MSIRKFINLEEYGTGPFGSGNIGAGAFVFHRSVYEEIGPIPELGLWDFSKNFLEKNPECKPFFEVKQEDGRIQYNSLGNPWGDDFYYFYTMTRKFPSKYLDFAPYYVHSRFGHKWPEEPDFDDKQGAKKSWNPQNI